MKRVGAQKSMKGSKSKSSISWRGAEARPQSVHLPGKGEAVATASGGSVAYDGGRWKM